MLTLVAATCFVLPVFAQGGANRTGPGIPAPQPTNTIIVETRHQRDCRLHCGSLAATPNWKTLPTAAETQMRTKKCQRQMIVKD